MKSVKHALKEDCLSAAGTASLNHPAPCKGAGFVVK